MTVGDSTDPADPANPVDPEDPVRLEVRGGELGLVTTGDLDVKLAHRPAELLHAYFIDHVDPRAVSTAVVVDLTAVRFADSTGLGGLIRAQQEAGVHGLPFALRGVGPRLMRLLQMTGLDLQFGLD